MSARYLHTHFQHILWNRTTLFNSVCSNSVNASWADTCQVGQSRGTVRGQTGCYHMHIAEKISREGRIQHTAEMGALTCLVARTYLEKCCVLPLNNRSGCVCVDSSAPSSPGAMHDVRRKGEDAVHVTPNSSKSYVSGITSGCLYATT